MVTPAVQREVPKKNNSLRDFQGVNTQAARQVIGDNQFAWLENVQPVGFGNMPAVPGPSDALATWTGTAYHMKAVNIAGVDYELVFTTDGALFAVNLSSYAVTTVAPAATLSGAGSEVAQWENAQALIIDPTNGYFVWDGAALTRQNDTVQSLTITDAGQNYDKAPTISFSGGGGSGATATATLSAQVVYIKEPGTGYIVGDVLTILSGTRTVPVKVTVTAVTGSGGVAGISLTETGTYTVSPVNPLPTSGGYGVGVLFNANFGVGEVTLTNPGVGYTSAPTVTAVPVGTSWPAVLALPFPGSTGYAIGDVLTVVGGTFTTAAQITVQVVDGSGEIQQFKITTPGAYTVAPISPVTVTGGAGLNARFILEVVPSGTHITAALTVVPGGGTAIATYAGRVWIAANRTIAFSAPDSFSDFSSSGGGGSFIVVDETLHSSITSLTSANNFLYITGSSSVNVVADVNINLGVTTFSNTNISASIGTSQPYGVVPYYRALWFPAPYGIYALYGSTTQKASDDLDGVFPLITSAIKMTAGTAVLHNILTLCFMFKYADPVAGARTLIAIFFNKKWFFASQGGTLVHIDTAIVNGSPVLYATEGSHLYTLFTDETKSVVQTIVSKLWDMGDPLANKQALKFGLEMINPSTPQSVTGTLDTELTSGAVPFSLIGGNIVRWVNNSGEVVSWVNASNQVVSWIASGYTFQPIDVATTGRYLGVTLNGESARTVYAGMHLQFVHRTPWPQEGAQ